MNEPMENQNESLEDKYSIPPRYAFVVVPVIFLVLLVVPAPKSGCDHKTGSENNLIVRVMKEPRAISKRAENMNFPYTEEERSLLKDLSKHNTVRASIQSEKDRLSQERIKLKKEVQTAERDVKISDIDLNLKAQDRLWKEYLATIPDEHKRSGKLRQIEYWDFTLYNASSEAPSQMGNGYILSISEAVVEIDEKKPIRFGDRVSRFSVPVYDEKKGFYVAPPPSLLAQNHAGGNGDGIYTQLHTNKPTKTWADVTRRTWVPIKN